MSQKLYTYMHLLFFSLLLSTLPVLSQVGVYNIKDHKIAFFICLDNLETQWQWTLARTIEVYLPNLMQHAFSDFSNYPDYCLNFEGSYRYMLMKEFYPSDYNRLKDYVASGRWHPAGSCVDSYDAIVPSPESLIRHALYSNLFFEEEFNTATRSIDMLLPESLGLPWSLPTIATHAGLYGFSTQKFDLFGGWTDTPFSIGQWEGVDGSRIIACLKPGSGANQMVNIRVEDGQEVEEACGSWITYAYIGRNVVGPFPVWDNLQNRIDQNPNEIYKVISVPSDELFHQFLKYPEIADKLTVYSNELIMRTHGTGCYTSWAQMKGLNRMNERKAYECEAASVIAGELTSHQFQYPQETIRSAWEQFLAHQENHDLTGISIPSVYKGFSIPAEDSALAAFTGVLGSANTTIANILDTRSTQPDRRTVVVFNPLGIPRTDIVSAEIDWGSIAPSEIQVFDTQTDEEVPSQVNGHLNNTLGFCFVAAMEPLSYRVFEISPTASSLSTALTITEDVLENRFYKIFVNANGDIASIYDKINKKELLAVPSRFEMRPDMGTTFPAWEIRYDNVTAPVREYVTGSVQKRIVENGPARVTLEVIRSQAGSTFTHYIRLGSGEAGSCIHIDNFVKWESEGTLLKVGFPLTCSNDSATFDMGIGVIKRPTQDGNRYEVPAQKWVDLSASDGSYGVSVLTDCKYGWNKESNSKINLSLIHSPKGGGYNYECDLTSVISYVHKFSYGIYGHAGTWNESNVVHESERIDHPLICFKPNTANAGIARSYSFLSVNKPENMAIMAVKQSERDPERVIVRVREIKNETVPDATITFGAATVNDVTMVDGQEMEITNASLLPLVKPKPPTKSGNSITFELPAFGIRAFSVDLRDASGIGPVKPSHKNNLGIPFILSLYNNRIRFALKENEKVKRITITDMAGRIIQNISYDSLKQSGYRWTTAPISSGMYIINCITNKDIISSRLPIIN